MLLDGTCVLSPASALQMDQNIGWHGGVMYVLNGKNVFYVQAKICILQIIGLIG